MIPKYEFEDGSIDFCQKRCRNQFDPNIFLTFF